MSQIETPNTIQADKTLEQSAEASLQAPELKKTYTTHVVSRGQNPTSIAVAHKTQLQESGFWKQGESKWAVGKKLAQLNGTNPRDLKIGQTLKIPSLGIESPDNSLEPGKRIHTVSRGDTLTGIVENNWNRFEQAGFKSVDKAVEQLAAKNGIRNKNHIRIGQKITLPSYKSSSTALVQDDPNISVTEASRRRSLSEAIQSTVEQVNTDTIVRPKPRPTRQTRTQAEETVVTIPETDKLQPPKLGTRPLSAKTDLAVPPSISNNEIIQARKDFADKTRQALLDPESSYRKFLENGARGSLKAAFNQVERGEYMVTRANSNRSLSRRLIMGYIQHEAAKHHTVAGKQIIVDGVIGKQTKAILSVKNDVLSNTPEYHSEVQRRVDQVADADLAPGFTREALTFALTQRGIGYGTNKHAGQWDCMTLPQAIMNHAGANVNFTNRGEVRWDKEMHRNNMTDIGKFSVDSSNNLQAENGSLQGLKVGHFVGIGHDYFRGVNGRSIQHGVMISGLIKNSDGQTVDAMIINPSQKEGKVIEQRLSDYMATLVKGDRAYDAGRTNVKPKGYQQYTTAYVAHPEKLAVAALNR